MRYRRQDGSGGRDPKPPGAHDGRQPFPISAWRGAMAEDPVSLMRDLLTARGVAPDIVREVSATIRREYGGSAVYVQAVDHSERDAKVKELLVLGASAKAIAKATGLHPASVRRKRSAWF